MGVWCEQLTPLFVLFCAGISYICGVNACMLVCVGVCDGGSSYFTTAVPFHWLSSFSKH